MSKTQQQQQTAIVHYLCAKDQNRPHRMKQVFTESASLEMQVNSDNIAFPPETRGREAITELLVRQFGQTYENVYTFCLTDSINSQADHLDCRWLVAMSERANGSLRVGWGHYDWYFDNADNTDDVALANRLRIQIEQMQVLEPEYADQVLGWASHLPYPWCNTRQLLETLPQIPSLQPLRELLN